MPIFDLPLFRYLDVINAQLTRAISVTVRVTFSDEDRAWFRRPIGGHS